MSEWLKLGNTSAVPTMVVQYALGVNLSSAITYFEPPLRSSLRQGGKLSPRTYAALHIAGAYAVPPSLSIYNVTSEAVAAVDMNAWLGFYKQGILTGKIEPASVPQSAAGCFQNQSWYAYVPDWTVESHGQVLKAKAKPTFNCPVGALIKKCPAKSTTLPKQDVRCFAPGAVIQLRTPAQPSSERGLLLIDPLLPTTTSGIILCTLYLCCLLHSVYDDCSPAERLTEPEIVTMSYCELTSLVERTMQQKMEEGRRHLPPRPPVQRCTTSLQPSFLVVPAVL